MNPTHLLLLLLVVFIWGLNFVFIRLALNELPPLLLCALRFFLAAFPAVFFVRRPPGSVLLLASYGIVMFAIQFSFLFSGMKVGMPASLASLTMQFQVFFTLGLAFVFFNERPSLWKLFGAALSFSGILYVAAHLEGDVTLAGLTLTLMAALSWATGNILSKKMGQVSPFALVVWGSLYAFPILCLASILFEGPQQITTSISQISWIGISALFFIAYLSTHVAYSLWSHFLKTYPAAMVAPFTLLVPVFGFIGSAVILNEALPSWKITAAILVVAGLCFNLLEGKFRTAKNPQKFEGSNPPPAN